MSTQDTITKQRRIVHRTRGHGHGPIVRLMSPSDLGEHLKPFVFLDLFEADMRLMSEGMQIHPHSGLATVTVFTDGDVTYDDPQAGHGTIAYGGVEWMRAGGGVWHGKELSAGWSPAVQGFQLWLALPPELENGEVDSQYRGTGRPHRGPGACHRRGAWRSSQPRSCTGRDQLPVGHPRPWGAVDVPATGRSLRRLACYGNGQPRSRSSAHQG